MPSLSCIGVAIQKRQEADGLALLQKLAGHLEYDHTAGGVTGKVVRSGWLHCSHLLHTVSGKYSQVRLMLIEKLGELEAIHGLRGTEPGSQLDKAQQASSNSVGNKEGRQKSAGLDGDQRRPFS